MHKLRILLRYRRILIIFAHFLIFIGAYLLAFLLRFDFIIPVDQQVVMYKALMLFVGRVA